MSDVGVIEHWWCPACGVFDGPKSQLRECGPWLCDHCELLGNEVEAMVPATRHRGAVEALEQIAAPQRPDGSWNRDREACRRLAQAALDNMAGREKGPGW